MSEHAIQFIFVNMFTGGTSSLTQLCIPMYFWFNQSTFCGYLKVQVTTF